MNGDFRIVSLQENALVPITVFQIHGDIDVNTGQMVEEKARQAYEQGMRYLLLDLSEVDYISSAGLRVIHMIYKMLRQAPQEKVSKGILDGSYRACHLKLLNPCPEVDAALKMTGFDMYLDVFSDRQQALEAFSCL